MPVKNRSNPPEQHGFMSSASTATQLSGCVFDWNLSLNREDTDDVIGSDLSEAFDKVSRGRLLSRLHELGRKRFLLRWFLSSCYDGKSGTPQGGVLS